MSKQTVVDEIKQRIKTLCEYGAFAEATRNEIVAIVTEELACLIDGEELAREIDYLGRNGLEPGRSIVRKAAALVRSRCVVAGDGWTYLPELPPLGVVDVLMTLSIFGGDRPLVVGQYAQGKFFWDGHETFPIAWQPRPAPAQAKDGS